MIRIVFVVFLLIIHLTSEAQSSYSGDYKTVGVGVHSNGWGAEYNFFNSNYKGFDGLTFSYQNYNHLAERKNNTETITNAKMVLNKINNLYLLRAGLIKYLEIGSRKDRSNIGVGATLAGGPVIAIYKPIFIEYSESDSSVINLREVRYNPAIHSANQIFDKSSFLTGIGESTSRFGLWGKASLRFDWGSYETNFKAIEIGFNVNYIPNSQDIIYSYPVQRVYSNMFVTLHFGSLRNN